MLKKLLASFLLFFLLFAGACSFITPAVKAQSTWYNQDYRDWYLKVYDDTNPTEIFGERYTAAQVQWIVYSLAAMPFANMKDIMQCALNPQDVAQCGDALTKLIVQIKSSPQYAKKSTPVNPWKEIFLTNRPFSGISYVRNRIQKFQIIPIANAQTNSFGYNTALEPVMEMWKGFRDVSYIFFVFIVVAYAFMIMFRMKISPQAAITIQSALPKLILTIIFVTFSYAIAGFMVDLMYILLALVTTLLVPVVQGPISSLGWDGVWALLNGGNLGLFWLLLVYFFLFLLSLLFNFVAWMFSGLSNIALGAIIALPLILIIIILLIGLIFYVIYKLFKVIFSLLKAVANLFIAVIFSPLTLTLSALGIGGGGIGSWLKGLLGTLLAFPVAGALLLLAFRFIGLSFEYMVNELVFGNVIADLLGVISNVIGFPLLGFLATVSGGSVPWAPPLIGGGWIGLIFLFASFTCISLIPKAVDIAKGLMEGKQFAYGTALGEALNEPVAGITMGANVAGIVGKYTSGIKALIPGKPVATTPPSVTPPTIPSPPSPSGGTYIP